VFTAEEATRVADHLSGNYRLMARLMHGSGLRVSECVALRVQDLDFDNKLVIVRNGKGGKDRSTLLSEVLIADLRRQINHVQQLHKVDVAMGHSRVHLPDALVRQNATAEFALGWQFLFPSRHLQLDPSTRIRRRHHTSSRTVQRKITQAISGLK